jgi:SAM-dependent methyltransferase
VPEPASPRSIVFDRAAGYYDETRGLPPAVQAAVADVLATELDGVGRCLEVGVGTGRMALPLHERGIPMAGADLSSPMLRRLVENAGGTVPFPLVRADGTCLPFRAGVFGAGLAVHVLHLVREWEAVVRGLVRVIGPGGRLLVDLGGAHGIHRDVTERFLEIAPAARRIGLTRPEPLDDLMASLGAGPPRMLEEVELPRTSAPVDAVERFAGNRYSGSWRLTDDERARAVEEVRRWVYEHYEDPETPRPDPVPIRFRSYVLA